MKIFLNGNDPLSECYLRYSDLLEKSNKYDCIIDKADVTDEILAQNKNILLVERLDGAAIWCRNLLKHPHVKTLLKMYHYPDPAVNNRPCVDGRIFIPLDGTEKKPEPELTAEDLAKVRSGFSFFHYSRLAPAIAYAKSAKLKPVNERELDFFFAGTTSYGSHARETVRSTWVTTHRQEVIDYLNELGKSGYRVMIAATRAFGSAKYLELTANTKIILSPFGWGEYCYRDYEALLLGCIVVKPWFPYVAQLPDINMTLKFAHLFPVCSADLESYHDLQSANWLVSEKENEKKIIEEILQ